MFIQIIQGRCTREQECRDMGERWLRELAPGATAGSAAPTASPTTASSSAVVRFESRDAAARERRPARAGRVVGRA